MKSNTKKNHLYNSKLHKKMESQLLLNENILSESHVSINNFLLKDNHIFIINNNMIKISLFKDNILCLVTNDGDNLLIQDFSSNEQSIFFHYKLIATDPEAYRRFSLVVEKFGIDNILNMFISSRSFEILSTWLSAVPGTHVTTDFSIFTESELEPNLLIEKFNLPETTQFQYEYWGSKIDPTIRPILSAIIGYDKEHVVINAPVLDDELHGRVTIMSDQYLLEEINYFNGYKHGLHIKYFEGHKVSERSYEYDLNLGREIFYYISSGNKMKIIDENGEIYNYHNDSNNTLDSLTIYDSDGNVWITEFYADGAYKAMYSLNPEDDHFGISIAWDKTSKVSSCITY